MKRKLAIAVAVTILTASWNALAVYGADHTMDSDVAIQFKEGEGPTKPVNPEEPEKPMEPEPPPVGGSLAIVYASKLNFGEITITPGIAQNFAVETAQPNVQVVDLRGTHKGWLLQASLSGFENADNQPSLLGAAIDITGGRMNAENVAAITDQPAPKSAYLTSDGTTVDVVVAEEGSGAGLWVTRFYPELITEDNLMQLYIPAASIVKGMHTATVTWKLVDDPTGGGAGA